MRVPAIHPVMQHLMGTADTATRALLEPLQGFTKRPRTVLPRVADLQPQLDAMFVRARADSKLLPHALHAQDFDLQVVNALSGPPNAAVQAYELDAMRAVQALRTPTHERITRYFANSEVMVYAERRIGELTRGMAPEDAARARQLLEDARTIADSATQVGKKRWARERPYAVDPTIKPSVYKPGDAGSHPSGHTSNGFSEMTLLATLDPKNASRYIRIGFELAQSRVVGGAHFPSDVVAGVYIGTRAGMRAAQIESDLVARVAAHNAR